MDRKQQSAQTAIGIMTAWLSEPEGGPFGPGYVNQLIDEGGDEALFEIISGLVSVAGHLLVKTARATGRTEQEVLQELGARYQR